jgi:type IV secretion system protein VirD4
LALDECANAAPLPDLPSTLSEGGGQGVQTATIFQDMSQSRRHWPADADGMMSMFGAMVIMGGIADRKTLEQISLLCGEYDREVQTLSYDDDHTTVFGGPLPNARQSWTTRREPRLSPDEIARLPKGKALVIIGPDWQIVPAIPYDQHPTFAQLTRGPLPALTRVPESTPAPGPHNGKAPDGGAVTEPRSGEGKEAKRP